jgi:hypothetical protein
MPNYIKKPIEPILNDKEVKTSFTDINKFVSGVVNGVDVKAAHYFYGNGWEAKVEWWRMGVRLPGSFVDDLEWVVGNWGGMIVAGKAAGFFYSKVAGGLCAKVAPLCGTMGVVIAAYYFAITGTNRFYCNKSGVWVYKNHIFPIFGTVSLVAGSPYTGCY